MRYHLTNTVIYNLNYTSKVSNKCIYTYFVWVILWLRSVCLKQVLSQFYHSHSLMPIRHDRKETSGKTKNLTRSLTHSIGTQPVHKIQAAAENFFNRNIEYMRVDAFVEYVPSRYDTNKPSGRVLSPVRGLISQCNAV